MSSIETEYLPHEISVFLFILCFRLFLLLTCDTFDWMLCLTIFSFHFLRFENWEFSSVTTKTKRKCQQIDKKKRIFLPNHTFMGPWHQNLHQKCYIVWASSMVLWIRKWTKNRPSHQLMSLLVCIFLIHRVDGISID